MLLPTEAPSLSASSIPPAFDWRTRHAFRWFEADQGFPKLRSRVRQFVDFELDNFQVECAARLLDGQDVLCINATGAGKSALIYIPLMVRDGTMSIVVSPTNCLQRDMARGMQKKGITCLAINSETLTAALLMEPPRDLWAMARSGLYRLVCLGPETLKSSQFDEFILDGNVRARLGLFAVDELHLGDEWGADFRPDFRVIASMNARCPEHTTHLGLSASIEPGRQLRACIRLMGLRPGYHIEKKDCERHTISLFMRPIKYTTSGLVFRDLDWLVPQELDRPSDVPKRLVFVQSIEQGHRVVLYLRTLLPRHLKPMAKTIIRHHHSLACPDCKVESMNMLYESGEDRNCLIHVSTDVLTVGVDIPALSDVVIFGKIGSLSTLVQRAGRPARERGSTGCAYVYVAKSDLNEAQSYIASEEGKRDHRTLKIKDTTSHVEEVHMGEGSNRRSSASHTQQVDGNVEQDGGEEQDDQCVEGRTDPIIPSHPTSCLSATLADKPTHTKSKVIDRASSTSLLLVFAAYLTHRCISRQLNMIYDNPGVNKDCGRCSSCVGDLIPKPRNLDSENLMPLRAQHLDMHNKAYSSITKLPGWMRLLGRDLKVLRVKILAAARRIQWASSRSDYMFVSACIFLPPTVMERIVTPEFLLLDSKEAFLAAVGDWKSAEKCGDAMWETVQQLVCEIGQQLKVRHEASLEKQRAARIHKSLVCLGLDKIKRVRLVVQDDPAHQPSERLVRSSDSGVSESVIPAAQEPGPVPPELFYAGVAKRKAVTQTGSRKRIRMDKENTKPDPSTLHKPKTARDRNSNI
ncbi:unnamed protein product [Mycena citricolor]|uniref:DNA 3'-5' helicase n=1 Tax=Mycena citricolor TaxID=2018698 RepID=A0AAD2GT79_9AGAR|nr:unnamed protein product [Mycena citricolor]